MVYKNTFEFDCPDCNQKYKILHNSREIIEFCPFCGELIAQNLVNVDLTGKLDTFESLDDLEDDEDDDDDKIRRNDW